MGEYMKVPHFRYRCLEFFGNSEWYTYNLNSPLSLDNPLSIKIGITTEVDSSLGAFTKLQSNWVWRHTFNNMNSSNFWSSDSANGSNGSTNPQSMGLNISSGYNPVGSALSITECYITSGYGTPVKASVSSIQFSSYNDWYFTPGITSPDTASSSAIVFKTAATYIADLPTQMYSINNRTITWNLTHPVCILLYGQECFTA